MYRTTNSPLNYYSPVFHTTQEHRNESVSSARVTNEQPEQHNMKTKKKKCHGNLKLQRIHRRQRNQEIKRNQMECSVGEHDALRSTSELETTSSVINNLPMYTDTVSQSIEVGFF